MRGKLIESYCLRFYHRITPADAGKTANLVDTFFVEQDHPRGCGENNLGRNG